MKRNQSSRQRFGIRKLTVGVGSLIVGTCLWIHMGDSDVAEAAETKANTNNTSSENEISTYQQDGGRQGTEDSAQSNQENEEVTPTEEEKSNEDINVEGSDQAATQATQPQDEVTENETNTQESTSETTFFAMPSYGSAEWLNAYNVSYGFGSYPLPNNNGMHYGVDLPMPQGTPVRAITGGTVKYAGWDQMGGGNTITVQEPDGQHSQFYMHLSGFNVAAGQTIQTGQIIGYSGNTGASTGPHLHFQRMNGYPSNETAENPLPFLQSLGYGNGGQSGGSSSASHPGFQENQYGTLYKEEHASFTPNTSIITRKTGPFINMPRGGTLEAGQTIHYDEVMKQDGYVWLGYDSNGGRRYLPIRTWNRTTDQMGSMWGTIS
ncbi:peptidoglycan DD-metalloendopeptidase family protein [Staphylococcus pettenkoferi]|uniref:peptidoglycan DD-metalloendopeptidase family protein n=1 Tax=Staphylococcus pettenkoferi TaxID=170573 RepID=UPI001C8C00B3|nr:peptidoglycan DD-metalloendopeptidase family protein [Staphylococcus pettenkoferi]MBX8994098.1 peptidoglycan DD-metalloendopeptidase family protein [Staphylococcus pettenkoferi]